MNFKELMKNIVSDVRVELTDQFDRNFEKKSFFGEPWKATRGKNARGSLMMRSGKLRRSIRSSQTNNSISWSSSLPYASLHNQGGEVAVTAKMKRFFWAMYYKASGAVKGKGERAQRLSAEAQMWKAMALQKVGTKMKIEQRQFIGEHPKVTITIDQIIQENLKEFNLNQP